MLKRIIFCIFVSISFSTIIVLKDDMQVSGSVLLQDDHSYTLQTAEHIKLQIEKSNIRKVMENYLGLDPIKNAFSYLGMGLGQGKNINTYEIAEDGGRVYLNSFINYNIGLGLRLDECSIMKFNAGLINRNPNYTPSEPNYFFAENLSATYLMRISEGINFFGEKHNALYLGVGIDYDASPFIQLSAMASGNIPVKQTYSYNSSVGFHLETMFVTKGTFIIIPCIEFLSVSYKSMSYSLNNWRINGISYTPDQAKQVGVNDLIIIDGGGWLLEFGCLFNL